MIGIINYGLGNIRAFINVYKNLNVPIKVVSELEDLDSVTKIILPGVGDFDHAMLSIQESGLLDTLNGLVLDQKMPVLGVCVGMQVLAKTSEEGKLPGLGWIDGNVKKFSMTNLGRKLPIPHMGWNDVKSIGSNKLFTKLNDGAKFYFLHSYYFDCNNKDSVLALAEYGNSFECAVHNENIYGVQFHPEKSHSYGIQLLQNFANL